MTVNDTGKRYSAFLPLRDFFVKLFNVRNVLFGISAVIETKIDNHAIVGTYHSAGFDQCARKGFLKLFKRIFFDSYKTFALSVKNESRQCRSPYASTL